MCYGRIFTQVNNTICKISVLLSNMVAYVFYLVTCLGFIQAQSSSELQLYSKFVGRILNVIPFSFDKTTDEISCSIACTENLECVSANVYKNGNNELVCVLMNSTMCYDESTLLEKPDGVYMEIQNCDDCKRKVVYGWTQWLPNDLIDATFKYQNDQRQRRECTPQGCHESECRGEMERNAKCQPGDCISIRKETSSGRFLLNFEGSRISVYSAAFNPDSNTERLIRIGLRASGLSSFNKTWEDYKYGFGAAAGNGWIGNEKIHVLTNRYQGSRIRIIIKHASGSTTMLSLADFKVSNESDGYRLSYGSVQFDASNIAPAFSPNNGAKFSTFDKDNDEDPNSNCALEQGGGWWFTDCGETNLNGEYPAHLKWGGVDLADINFVMYQTFIKV